MNIKLHDKYSAYFIPILDNYEKIYGKCKDIIKRRDNNGDYELYMRNKLPGNIHMQRAIIMYYHADVWNRDEHFFNMYKLSRQDIDRMIYKKRLPRDIIKGRNLSKLFFRLSISHQHYLIPMDNERDICNSLISDDIIYTDNIYLLYTPFNHCIFCYDALYLRIFITNRRVIGISIMHGNPGIRLDDSILCKLFYYIANNIYTKITYLDYTINICICKNIIHFLGILPPYYMGTNCGYFEGDELDAISDKSSIKYIILKYDECEYIKIY
jgi:hypothetical protein